MKKNIIFVFLAALLFIACGQKNELTDKPFKFAFMSDSRGSDNGVNSIALKKLSDHMLKNHSDLKFLLFAGDLIDGSWDNPAGNREQMKYWKEVMKDVYDNPELTGIKVYVGIGNHEVRTRFDEQAFKEIFPELPKNGPETEKGLTYSFDFNNTHFVVIDTDRWYYGDPNDTTDDKPDWHKVQPEAMVWLENDLQKAVESGAERIFVSGHEMPFPAGGHLRDGFAYLGRNFDGILDSSDSAVIAFRDNFWSLLVENNVSAYLCGHEHLYSRQSIDGVFQIIGGSSGAPVYSFNPVYEEKDLPRKVGQEFTYNEAVNYYKALGYNYGPGKNSQKSDDFVGYRAMHYIVFTVDKENIKAEVYGMKIKDGSMTEHDNQIRLIDKFIIE